MEKKKNDKQTKTKREKDTTKITKSMKILGGLVSATWVLKVGTPEKDTIKWWLGKAKETFQSYGPFVGVPTPPKKSLRWTLKVTIFWNEKRSGFPKNLKKNVFSGLAVQFPRL